MKAILTLALKDMRVVSRDRFALFWIFAFPIGYALFFGSIFGSSDDDGPRGRISLAIVDDDRSAASVSFAERLAQHSSLQVDRTGKDAAGPVASSTLEVARDAVRTGERVAYVHIPAGYGDSPFALFDQSEGPSLELGIDPSRSAEAGMLRGILMQSAFEGLTSTFTDKGAMSAQIGLARADIEDTVDLGSGQELVFGAFLDALDNFVADADFDALGTGNGQLGDDLLEVVDVTRERGEGPQSAYDITFPSAVIWGLMSTALTFALTLVRERTSGTLLRLRIAPISRAQLLAGKAAGCFGMCMIVMIAVLSFGAVALGVRFESPLLVLLATLATSFCFTGLMMTASVMGRTEQAVSGAAWGALMPLAMIGGGMIPLVAMPSWLLTLSDYSPFK